MSCFSRQLDFTALFDLTWLQRTTLTRLFKQGQAGRQARQARQAGQAGRQAGQAGTKAESVVIHWAIECSVGVYYLTITQEEACSGSIRKKGLMSLASQTHRLVL